MKRHAVPRSLLERVEAELLAGEDLLWVGQPGAAAPANGVWPSRPGAMLVIMGVMAALVAGMLVMLLSRGLALVLRAPQPFIVFGIITLAAVLVSAVPLVRRWLNPTIAYAITDRRALILTTRSVQSYSAKDMQFIERRMRAGDRGDLIFQRETRTGPGYVGNGLYAPRWDKTLVGFFDIPHVREVEALMLETFQGSGVGKPKRTFSGEVIYDDEGWPADEDEAEARGARAL